MRKYWHVLTVGIQNTLVYRVNFLFRACFGLVPLLAVISLWRTVYASKSSEVAGYTLAQMISYYLVVTIVDALTAVYDDDWQIAADIRDGNISQFLLKPVDYLAYRFCLFSATRLIYTAVASVPVALFVLGLHRYFLLPPDAGTCALFFFSLALTAALQFLISYTLALLAFWVLERPPARRRLPRPVPHPVHLYRARAPGGKRPGQTAGGQAPFAPGNRAAPVHVRRVPGPFGTGLALFPPALYQRQLVKKPEWPQGVEYPVEL